MGRTAIWPFLAVTVVFACLAAYAFLSNDPAAPGGMEGLALYFYGGVAVASLVIGLTVAGLDRRSGR